MVFDHAHVLRRGDPTKSRMTQSCRSAPPSQSWMMNCFSFFSFFDLPSFAFLPKKSKSECNTTPRSKTESSLFVETSTPSLPTSQSPFSQTGKYVTHHLLQREEGKSDMLSRYVCVFVPPSLPFPWCAAVGFVPPPLLNSFLRKIRVR